MVRVFFMSLKIILNNWKNFINKTDKEDDFFNSAHVVIPNNKNEVLLLKRSDTDSWMPGKWSLPGGGKKGNESLLEAAVREVSEETGLHVNPKDLYFLKDLSKQQKHVFFLAKKALGSIHLDNENSEFKWMNPKNLLKEDCTPGLLQILESSLKMYTEKQKIPKGFEKTPFTNKLKGGAADDAEPDDFNPKKLRKGIEHEFEHSSDIDQAKETAADHLIKYNHYYDELEKMEKNLEKQKPKEDKNEN